MPKKRYSARIKKYKWTIIILGPFVLIILMIVFVAAPRMGKWLIHSQNLQKSDLIFVLMGSIPDRALQTADIYHSGYAGKIVFANEQQFGAEKLKPYGIELETTASILKSTLVKLRVPQDSIEILPNVATCTQDEAIILRDYLKLHPLVKSVIIVTSSYHSQRVSRIFGKALKKSNQSVTLVISSNKYTDFKPIKWWKERDSAIMVFMEYMKLINFYLIEQFKL